MAILSQINSRVAECSDYPRAEHLEMSKYYNNRADNYLLRSHRGDYMTSTFIINYNGGLNTTGNQYVFAARPAMRLNVS
jgi:hypothetical protein